MPLLPSSVCNLIESGFSPEKIPVLFACICVKAIQMFKEEMEKRQEVIQKLQEGQGYCYWYLLALATEQRDFRSHVNQQLAFGAEEDVDEEKEEEEEEEEKKKEKILGERVVVLEDGMKRLEKRTEEMYNAIRISRKREREEVEDERSKKSSKKSK
ncbi:MAG: hypothetical protein Q9181_007940, partial [Wetmoreana brouardii]